MKQPCILAYHAVHPERLDVINVSPATFATHMGWLKKRGLRGVSLAEFQEHKRRGSKALAELVAITFDDGYLDNLDHAWPILKDHGFTATVFVIPDRVGTDVVHDPTWLQLHPTVPASAYRYMDWPQVRTLMAQGVEIGSHTLTHPLLDQIPHDAQRREVFESKARLEATLGVPVKSFCYPAGHFEDATVRLVQQAGYQQAVVTPYQTGQIRGGDFTLERVGLYANDQLLRFRLKMSAWFPRFRRLAHRVRAVKTPPGAAKLSLQSQASS